MSTIDEISKEQNLDRNTFITLCIRKSYASLQENMKEKFLSESKRYIEEYINNAYSLSYRNGLKLSERYVNDIVKEKYKIDYEIDFF